MRFLRTGLRLHFAASQYLLQCGTMTTKMYTAVGEQATFTTRTHLARLVVLRNIGIAGVVTAVFFVWRVFDLSLPFGAMAAVIAVIALINGLTSLRLRQPWHVTDQEVFFQLSLDVLGLCVLMYLAGGSTNPFVSLLLFPLILAVTLLPSLYSWAMAVLTVLCYTALLYWYVPLVSEVHHLGDATNHEHMSSSFHLHIIGMWFNFVVSAGLIVTVAVRMMESIRSRDHMLAEAREDTLRNERFIAVGTMAAGAAHELGTPLSTIAVVCKELQLEYGKDRPLADSLQIIRNQVDQCKQILSNLLVNSENPSPVVDTTMALDKHLERILDKWLLVRPYVHVNTAVNTESQQPAPQANWDRTIDQALINLLNNAADVSPDNVDVELAWSETQAIITIQDRGPGLSEEALRNVGKAFFTTKSPSHGFGIGLYLANATIERFGGEVRWFNRDGGGAITQVRLPLNTTRAGSR